MPSTRQVGETRDVGFEIGVRRTLAATPEALWELLIAPEGQRLWLGGDVGGTLGPGCTYRLGDGTSGEVRVFAPFSHLRITWHPPGWPRASLIQVRVLPAASGAVLAFHQEHLPGAHEREQRREYFRAALAQLAERV